MLSGQYRSSVGSWLDVYLVSSRVMKQLGSSQFFVRPSPDLHFATDSLRQNPFFPNISGRKVQTFKLVDIRVCDSHVS
jgi:hypothetical protein